MDTVCGPQYQHYYDLQFTMRNLKLKGVKCLSKMAQLLDDSVEIRTQATLFKSLRSKTTLHCA